MSTRAVITFKDEMGKFAVYIHQDGDPKEIMDSIKAVKNCWDWPRWEANDFAAAYVATHKNRGGGIRLSRGAQYHADLEYTYTVTQEASMLKVTFRRDGGKAMQTYLDMEKVHG